MVPSEDLYRILEDHTPGFKQASFIIRIKKCQNGTILSMVIVVVGGGGTGQ